MDDHPATDRLSGLEGDPQVGTRIALGEAELRHHGEGALHLVHVGITLDAVVKQRAGIVVGDGGDASDTGQPQQQRRRQAALVRRGENRRAAVGATIDGVDEGGDRRFGRLGRRIEDPRRIERDDPIDAGQQLEPPARRSSWRRSPRDHRQPRRPLPAR